MQVIIGVDIGTSGTKAIAFTSEGSVTGNAYMSYNPVVSPPGHHELDPEVLFNAVITCIEKVVQQIKALPGTIEGISFSAAMHSLIAVDKAGRPLTNVLTWADARSTAYAHALKQTRAGNDIYRHTGTPIHPMSPLCKIMWIGENQPAIFNATHKFISIKEFIFYRFFDQYLIDHSIASATGLFDIYKKAWFTPALAAAGITTDHLSQPIFTTQIIKGLKNDYAQQLGISADTPFIIGASDGCLANLGSNATQPGDMSVTIGTSGAVRMTTTQPAYDQQERIFNYILRDDLYVTGGAVNNGVVLLKWYSEHFLQKPFTNASDLAAFVQQAAGAPAGADGLIFLPYILGERAPVWDASARGVFFGIHAGHTQAHFMRAIIEGINYSLYQVAASVDETVGAIQHIYASGGFINSPLWLQWLTDVFGKEIKVINNEDASSVGAAILGWQSLGIFKDNETASFFHIQQQYQPDLTLHASYQRYYNVYAGLYNKLKDDFQTLNNIRSL
ncbi:MAG TPA: gluconokinase [Niastella sp.]